MERFGAAGPFFLPALPFAPRKVPAQQAEVPRACLNPRSVSPLLVTLGQPLTGPAIPLPHMSSSFHSPPGAAGMMLRAPGHFGGLQPLPPPPLPSRLHFPALAAAFWKAGYSGAVSSLDSGVQEARAPIPATPLLLGFMTSVRTQPLGASISSSVKWRR